MSRKPRQSALENTTQEEMIEDPFWLENYPKLQRYCHFLAQNKWDGDDIAQETFIKARKYNAPQQKITSALLNRIAYNHWVDLHRKRKKETMEAELTIPFMLNQSDDIANTVELLQKRLTPKQAVIFMLKEAFQYQYKEIASLLRTTEMAVKSNLHRAKKRLEKGKEGEESFSVEAFWDEAEREELSELFYEALKIQDPTVLIQAVPSLKTVSDGPKFISGKSRAIQTNTPSSTLCMAA